MVAAAIGSFSCRAAGVNGHPSTFLGGRVAGKPSKSPSLAMGDTTTDLVLLQHPAARRSRLELDEGHRSGPVTARQAPRPPAPAPSWSRAVEALDRAVARALRVQPQSLVPHQPVPANGSRPFETPLLIAGVRCTMRYIVLPFVLPLLGVATGATIGIVTGAALGLLLTLDVIAVIAIVATLRRLWRLHHPRRWQYLPEALVLGVLVGFFFVNDARALFV